MALIKEGNMGLGSHAYHCKIDGVKKSIAGNSPVTGRALYELAGNPDQLHTASGSIVPNNDEEYDDGLDKGKHKGAAHKDAHKVAHQKADHKLDDIDDVDDSDEAEAAPEFITKRHPGGAPILNPEHILSSQGSKVDPPHSTTMMVGQQEAHEQQAKAGTTPTATHAHVTSATTGKDKKK